jgi:cyclopropane-fatty-acyl-phospholipid synthase
VKDITARLEETADKTAGLREEGPAILRSAQPASVGWLDALARRVVLAALRPMRRGCLRLSLPEGGEVLFGEAGAEPAAEVRVHHRDFFRRCALDGDLGFGEAYQAGDWDTPDLVAVIRWFCSNVESSPTMAGSSVQRWHFRLFNLGNRFRHRLRRNTESGSRANIQAHYDLGNAFYRLWLDPGMTYSSALFEFPDQSLEAAQDAKYDRLCRQLRLRPTDDVLEIGSGWGGFTRHAIRHYGCRVTTVTISQEQKRFAEERFQREGLADRATVRLMDYRRLPELGLQFDKIASIEMLEAVGDEYLETFFGICQGLLRRHGLLAAQFITCPDARHQELRNGVDWIQKHIFPGSLLLSLQRMSQATTRASNLQLHDLRDFGPDYARTLGHWRVRFNAGLDAVRAQGFDERFIRTWNYYLAYCEAAFATRNISVVQAVWTAPNNPTLD